MVKRKTEKQKKRIVELYAQGKAIAALCQRYSLGQSMLHSWIKQYKAYTYLRNHLRLRYLPSIHYMSAMGKSASRLRATGRQATPPTFWMASLTISGAADFCAYEGRPKSEIVNDHYKEKMKKRKAPLQPPRLNAQKPPPSRTH